MISFRITSGHFLLLYADYKKNPAITIMHYMPEKNELTYSISAENFNISRFPTVIFERTCKDLGTLEIHNMVTEEIRQELSSHSFEDQESPLTYHDDIELEDDDMEL